jgi:predicted DNA-binding ribbon-helix-helix protein
MIRAVLVDPGAEAGRAKLKGQYGCCVCAIFVTLQNFCEMAVVEHHFCGLCAGLLNGGIFMKSPVVKRSIILAGHKTSVSLEDAFWNALKEIARKRLTTLSDLIGAIDSQRQRGNLSSALRLFVLEFYRSQIPEEGRQGPHEMMDHPEPFLSQV